MNFGPFVMVHRNTFFDFAMRNKILRETRPKAAVFLVKTPSHQTKAKFIDV